MKQHIAITESEWLVMKIIWNEPPKTLQDILSNLQHSAWSTTTIQTYLARLVKKGALNTERQGKGYLYYPAITENDCQLAESKSFLSRVYDGSLARMVSGFVKSGDLSAEELLALKALIEEQEKKI
ncbi:MAG: BlaI/MecI/CopY family transcriptional regulator [Lachnospiraceae bacterium]|nr:BlaI/MecI/CopY family transcriptional regulator [Lachnospiraceae bacterium]MDD3794433.1 BlaI/MecI/CopY family transcriptional regulator [Lachnospiraceae bacterium]